MKIQILSDLHVEFGQCELQRTDADVVVLAGDIHLGNKGFYWARENFTEQDVVYILGNHEFYSEATPKLIDNLIEKSKGTNIHILENSAVTINAVRFLGCTLWTDFELLGNIDVAIATAQLWMTDFKKIRISPHYKKARPSYTVVWHKHSLKWIKQEIESCKKEKVIIVSHHAPSIQSISSQHRNDPLGAAFASNLEDFVRGTNAAFWVHGHIHKSSDYMIGNTRILCNPLGYPDERNARFDQHLTIDI